MTLKEIEQLEKRFFQENDNRTDYNAYLLDRDLALLNRVVFFWAKTQGITEIEAKNFSLYIANKAQKDK